MALRQAIQANRSALLETDLSILREIQLPELDFPSNFIAVAKKTGKKLFRQARHITGAVNNCESRLEMAQGEWVALTS